MIEPSDAFIALGVPIDCAGADTGVERMPRALRDAGLIDTLGIIDLGDLPVAINSTELGPHDGDYCLRSGVWCFLRGGAHRG